MSNFGKRGYRANRRSRSLFAAMLLLGMGIYFLLVNLGAMPVGDWSYALRYWPLFLVFLGLNLLVRAVRHPWGTFMSGVVGLTCFSFFVSQAMNGPEAQSLPWVQAGEMTYQTEGVEVAKAGVETAVIRLGLNANGANVSALEDSNALLAGEVSYLGDLAFESDVRQGQATVRLWDEADGWNFFPMSVPQSGDPWQLGISPDVPVELNLDLGAGAVNLDLAELQLTDLNVDGGASDVLAVLPGGDYEVQISVGAGNMTLVLPTYGRQVINLDGGVGEVTVVIPPNRPLQTDVDNGVGTFTPDARLQLVQGNNDDGVWQTADYNPNGANMVQLIVDVGVGNVTVQPVEGR